MVAGSRSSRTYVLLPLVGLPRLAPGLDNVGALLRSLVRRNQSPHMRTKGRPNFVLGRRRVLFVVNEALDEDIDNAVVPFRVWRSPEIETEVIPSTSIRVVLLFFFPGLDFFFGRNLLDDERRFEMLPPHKFASNNTNKLLQRSCAQVSALLRVKEKRGRTAKPFCS